MNKAGLTSKQAAELLKQHGENVLVQNSRINPMKIFLAQFKDFFTIILIIATVLSFVMNEAVEGIAILAIIFINCLLGFFQEYKTEKTIDALKALSSPTTKVIRDGVIKVVPSSQLVVGDIIQIESGDKVPADAKILEQFELEIDEAVLTGESIPSKKMVSNTSSGDFKENICYMGTIAIAGRGKACVLATGMNTEMGKIAGMLKNIDDPQTPLQKRLDQLGKYIAIMCIVICSVVAVVGILSGQKVLDMIIMGISLAVAAVPEGLPAIVTIALALAVSRMVKRKALIRKLHAVETLGCSSVVCSDKTGTLTENKMTVTQIYTSEGSYKVTGSAYDIKGDFLLDGKTKSSIGDKGTLNACLKGAILCNNAQVILGKKLNATGNPTEIALLIAGLKAGLNQAGMIGYSKVSELPFDSTRKMMSVQVQHNNKNIIFTKGAPDILLKKCSSIMTFSGVVPMTDRHIRQIEAENVKMASSALRVICIATKDSQTAITKNDEVNLTFIGLMGMIDPPRKASYGAVKVCRQAGIKPVMITGDHKVTATAIAKELDIYRPGDLCYTGDELDMLDDKQLLSVVNKTSVYARVSPRHKLRIVKAYKAMGEVVAMTGDGVNDAPAIKEADIGIAMGITGTDVTKEAAGVILMDDNFATLIAAIEEGRLIYKNIRKFIRYLLACNVGEVLAMLIGMLMGLPLILLPIQILLINLVTDGLPAIALGVDPHDSNVMTEKPRRTNDGVLSGGLGFKIIFRGIIIAICTVSAFVIIYNESGNEVLARSGAFLTLVLTQLIHVFECKSETKSLLNINIFNNIKLILAVLLSFAIVISAIYLPFLQPVFNTQALSLHYLIYIAALSVIGPVVSAIINEFTAKNNN